MKKTLSIAACFFSVAIHASAQKDGWALSDQPAISNLEEPLTHNRCESNQEACALLVRLKEALTKNALLDRNFYTEPNLKQLFGQRYFFHFRPGTPSQIDIAFDDLGTVYVENGQPTTIGLHGPLLQRGSISFAAGSTNSKAHVGIGIVTSARVWPDATFFAPLLHYVFGDPTAVAAGIPVAPSPHGQSDSMEVKTHESGNVWLKYELDDPHHLTQVQFRTLGDAAVTEIQILQREK